MALLSQPFCNGCGSNLKTILANRLEAYEKVLVRARTAANEGRFADAIRLAQSIAAPPDYRFQEVCQRASELEKQIAQEQIEMEAAVAKAKSRVERYLPQDRYDDIVRILSRIPSGALPKELLEILQNCQAKTTTAQSSKTELKDALAAKKYDVAVQCLAQLVELNPGEKQYEKQLKEIAAKVVSKAQRYRERSEFQKALTQLQSVPSRLQDESYLETLHECEEVLFLRTMLAKATYMNPLVTAALEKLARYTKEDPTIEKLRQRSQKTRQESSKLTSQIWPEWMKPERGILGIAITPTRIPNAMPGTRPDCLANKGAQFWVAIGLAIQAAQNSMPHGDFLRLQKSKGLLGGLLGGKKSKTSEVGWGFDIGESFIKAVRIRLVGDPLRPQIEQAAIAPIERKSAKPKLERDDLEPALRKMLTDLPIGEERVVINYPGNELVPRFLLLPPNADRKRFEEFVLQDAKAHIPINMDLLQTAYHVSDSGESEHISPSALLLAARKLDIEARKELVEAAGLRVDGIQPESLAIVNALHAFLKCDPMALAIEEEDANQTISAGQSLADMILDVGYDRTNLIIAHPKGIWQRTINWGMADLNKAIINALQLTQKEADQMRREPLKAKYLQVPVEAMQAACQVPRREVERSAYAARDAIGDLRLRRVMLIGGGAYQAFLSSWLNELPY